MKFSRDFAGNHIMLDIETLGTNHNGMILTLGAVRFDPWAEYQGGLEQLLELDCFYRRIDTESYDGLDYSTDDDTVGWWSRQDAAVRAEAFAEDDRHPVSEVLAEFRRWAGDPDTAWANGVCFDVTMIEFFCRQTSQIEPWSPFRIRDARTVYALCPEIKRDQYTDAHHASVDCFAQIVQLQRCFRRLGVDYLEGWR